MTAVFVSRAILLLVLATGGYACTAKESDFFAPQPIDATLLPDTDAPIFSAIKPLSSVTVLNSSVLSFTVADSVGPNGALASGVDESTVEARLANGNLILLTAAGLNYSGSFASLNDGTISLTLSAGDKAGNATTLALNFMLDRTAPLIAFTTTPPAEAASSDDSLLATTAGTINDGAFSAAQLQVTQPGPDGVCGNADDVLWPKGNANGQVSENTFDVTSQVQANATFTASFFAYNAVASAGESQIAIYCGTVVGTDSAKDENGVAKPNRATRTWRSEVTWSR